VRRHYTVEEATKTLPYVRGIVAEICEAYRAIQELGCVHNATPSGSEQERTDLRREIRERAQRLKECCEELEQLGAELKDYESGLVDFPALLSGEEISLCWRTGEETVGFWHDKNAGFAGRQPIPQDTPDWPSNVRVASAARD
jgi:hypothetical protein